MKDETEGGQVRLDDLLNPKSPRKKKNGLADIIEELHSSLEEMDSGSPDHIDPQKIVAHIKTIKQHKDEIDKKTRDTLNIHLTNLLNKLSPSTLVEMRESLPNTEQYANTHAALRSITDKKVEDIKRLLSKTDQTLDISKLFFLKDAHKKIQDLELHDLIDKHMHAALPETQLQDMISMKLAFSARGVTAGKYPKTHQIFDEHIQNKIDSAEIPELHRIGVLLDGVHNKYEHMQVPTENYTDIIARQLKKRLREDGQATQEMESYMAMGPYARRLRAILDTQKSVPREQVLHNSRQVHIEYKTTPDYHFKTIEVPLKKSELGVHFVLDGPTMTFKEERFGEAPKIRKRSEHRDVV